MVRRARILLADDHQAVARALTKIVSREFEVVGAVENGLALVHAAAELRPDVIVADISMPLLDGIEALAELKNRNQAVKVVFITMYLEAAFARMALEAGACGFVLKHSAVDDLIPAIRAALDGETYISPHLVRKAVY
jgi:DNA-binding NarL/FixJ family response regulator